MAIATKSSINQQSTKSGSKRNGGSSDGNSNGSAKVKTTAKVTAGGGGGGGGSGGSVHTTKVAKAMAMVVMVAGFLGIANLIEVREANHQIENRFHCMTNHFDQAQCRHFCRGGCPKSA